LLLELLSVGEAPELAAFGVVAPPWLVLGLTLLLVSLLELGALLALLAELGCSPVLVAPPSCRLQPTSANAAQRIRIDFFIVDFLCFVTGLYSVESKLDARPIDTTR
jgi:hypothetical protein